MPPGIALNDNIMENLMRILIRNWDNPSIVSELQRNAIRPEYMSILFAAINGLRAPYTPTYDAASQAQRLAIGSPIRGAAAARSSPLVGSSNPPVCPPASPAGLARLRQSSVTSDSSFHGFSSPGGSERNIPPMSIGSPLRGPTSHPRSPTRNPPRPSGLHIETSSPATANPSISGPGASGLTPVAGRMSLNSDSSSPSSDDEETSGRSSGPLSSSPTKKGKSKDQSNKKKKKKKSKGKGKSTGISKKDRKDRDRDGSRRHGIRA
jgi:hypothetical protein